MDTEPTLEEIKELVSFKRDDDGKLQVGAVYGDVDYVEGNVVYVCGDVQGAVLGKIFKGK